MRIEATVQGDRAQLEASAAGSGGPSTLAPYQYCECEDAAGEYPPK